MIDADIRGIQEAQDAALRAIAATAPGGGLGRAVRYVTLTAHRFAVQNTPVDTGTWRAAQHPEVDATHGHIFVDPSATNPKSHTLASVYGPDLELRRGGRYAVYKKTVEEAGPQILAQAGQQIESELS